MLNEQDLKTIDSRGITAEMLDAQLRRLTDGFPWLTIDAAATVGHGITRLRPDEESACIAAWREFSGTVEKFVPASGAASRMFKDLYAFINSGRSEPETAVERKFFDEIQQFAFYPALNKSCAALHGKNVGQLMADKRHADVARCLLDEQGMGYGSLPKGLLLFHRSASGTHTPVEEHLEEAAQYAADSQRHAGLHFTISPEHRQGFAALLSARMPVMEKVWGVTFRVTMSEQKPLTDTIAATADGTPCRNADGTLLFRPAGHGALLENLNEREADVIFIKNIDNVVPLSLRHATTRYKKILAGKLVLAQRRVSRYLTRLEDVCRPDELADMLRFVEDELCVKSPATASMDSEALADYLRAKLNRPIRVCGMVRNEGEPGGGPYLVRDSDGGASPQILEAAQINPADPRLTALVSSGTHFNPVDLVCYIRDYKGGKFDLRQFVDPETGLVSEKSKNGITFRALELPGLWNGSMSDWNTIFVEVPIETFNPVKTVNDLLRPLHQG